VVLDHQQGLCHKLNLQCNDSLPLAKDERIAEEMSKRKQVERELAAVRAELDELGLG